MMQYQHRNTEWQSFEIVSRAALEVNPRNGVIWTNIAQIEYNRGNREEGGLCVCVCVCVYACVCVCVCDLISLMLKVQSIIDLRHAVCV